MDHYDIAIIGGGIAGASLAARLAGRRRCIILEMEERAGYHTTGRSASAYEPNYGPPTILALAVASGNFFRAPPQGFADAPVMTPRGSLFLVAEGQDERAVEFLAESKGLREISLTQAQDYFPVLRGGYAKRIFRDDATGDLDVDLIHRGFLKMARHHGVVLALSQPVRALERVEGKWLVSLPDRKITADVVVNAAGAWGDVVADMAGAKPVGLVPKRRSIAVVPIAMEMKSTHWPMVTDVGETWYCKPQSGKLLVSSADATPVEPHDAYADDMAIAEGIERLMTATTLEVERIEHSWGGLRSFVKDHLPVVGFDRTVPEFFWLVGQGGYGIMTSPALSEFAASLILQEPPSHALAEPGFDADKIAPGRKTLS